MIAQPGYLVTGYQERIETTRYATRERKGITQPDYENVEHKQHVIREALSRMEKHTQELDKELLNEGNRRNVEE